MTLKHEITVSVIIPTYNRAHCVGEAIDSVLAQDPPADEVIVIDDGSTDNTPDVLAAYGDRIRVIRQQNAGAGAARTAGLRQATGDWITFLDSDDLWYPGRLALLHHDLSRHENKNGDIVMHVADVRITGEGYDESLFNLRRWKISKGEVERVEDALPRAISALHLNGISVSHDIAANTRGFPSELKIAEDTYFICEVSLKGPTLFSNTIVAEVRRILNDNTAAVDLFRKDAVRAQHIAKRRFELILELSMKPAQRRLIRRHASGQLFQLARAEAETNTGTPRRTLVRMAMKHPNPIVGWVKALPPLLLGRFGFNLVPRKKPGFSRVR